VEPDRLFVDHGDIATSAGAGIDLCLHLVRQEHGPRTPPTSRGTW
jgi:AraC family transcriptional activator FtrA